MTHALSVPAGNESPANGRLGSAMESNDIVAGEDERQKALLKPVIGVR